jgi:hypothetical protein
MIHISTWRILENMLFSNIQTRGLGLWPNLRKTLNDFKDGRSLPLSKPCPEFVAALSSVLSVLNLLSNVSF